jgi:hypothetical protein
MNIFRSARKSLRRLASSKRIAQAISRPMSSIEPLESRTLLAGTVAPTIGIYSSIPNASETSPKKTGRGEFTVKRTGSTAKALKLQYYVAGSSTATAGSDYYSLAGTVTIWAGQTANFFSLYPIDDAIHEADESVIVILKPVAGYTVGHSKASVTIHDNDPLVTGDWFDSSRQYRTTFDVNVGTTARTNQPAEQSINFTSILSSLSTSGALAANSIRVVEISADGHTQLNANVPFQFDHDADFDASSKASGNLTILLTGNTAASTTRHYQVYFDTTGSFSAPVVTPRVTTTDNINDLVGVNSVKIQTTQATYYYQKAFGGFSSIVDKNGNDWTSWKPTGGSDGEFRGVPNLGPVGFHPGRDPSTGSDPGSESDTLTSTIVSSGPLKTVIESTATISGDKVRWEIYANFARCTVLSMDQNYWFLYEGTPGGSISANDTVVESDGTVTNVNSGTEWDHNHTLGSGNGEEWAYFRDASVNGGAGRYLYMVHNTPDNLVDSYYTMEGNMTVFGFARQNAVDHSTTSQLFTAGDTPNVFTIGLADGGSDFGAASGVVKGAYKALTVTPGAASTRPA